MQGLWVLWCPLQAPAGPGGWGDTCSAGAASAAHGRVGDRRNTAEEGFRLPGAAVPAPLGPFPPQQEVARSASSRRRPRAPFAGPAGTQGLPVATLSPERMPTARPGLAEKPSALFRSDLHPGDAERSEEPALIDGSVTGPTPRHLHLPRPRGHPRAPPAPSAMSRGALPTPGV